MSATAPVLLRRPPRLALKRWQIMALGWSVPAVLVGAYVGSNAVATTGQRDLRARWDAAVAEGRLDAAALAARSWAPGEPVARIAAPAIGLDVVVASSGGDRRRAPLHDSSTVVPGAPGVSVVTGGRFGYGNFFLGLERLRPGDVILVENLAGVVRFVVTRVEVVPAARVGPRADSLAPALALVSPARSFEDGMRLVVHAQAASGENPS